jgi:hypothetical protein
MIYLRDREWFSLPVIKMRTGAIGTVLPLVGLDIDVLYLFSRSIQAFFTSRSVGALSDQFPR